MLGQLFDRPHICTLKCGQLLSFAQHVALSLMLGAEDTLLIGLGFFA